MKNLVFVSSLFAASLAFAKTSSECQSQIMLQQTVLSAEHATQINQALFAPLAADQKASSIAGILQQEECVTLMTQDNGQNVNDLSWALIKNLADLERSVVTDVVIDQTVGYLLFEK